VPVFGPTLRADFQCGHSSTRAKILTREKIKTRVVSSYFAHDVEAGFGTRGFDTLTRLSTAFKSFVNLIEKLVGKILREGFEKSVLFNGRRPIANS